MREVFFLKGFADENQPKESEHNMDILLYAQPYDISAEGFYFRSVEEYEQNVKETKNSCGNPVEEFEIQFIDGGLKLWPWHNASRFANFHPDYLTLKI